LFGADQNGSSDATFLDVDIKKYCNIFEGVTNNTEGSVRQKIDFLKLLDCRMVSFFSMSAVE